MRSAGRAKVHFFEYGREHTNVLKLKKYQRHSRYVRSNGHKRLNIINKSLTFITEGVSSFWDRQI